MNRLKFGSKKLSKRPDMEGGNDLHLTVHVCHFPPGTSKWNKIEHRMFCHIPDRTMALATICYVVLKTSSK
jgi:Rhodopirellula transposase DDE domain